MLNRRHIRIKVMQTIYALNTNDQQALTEAEKFLSNSMHTMYDLHLLMLSLLCHIHQHSKVYLEKLQKKLLATEEERNPSKKFTNNQLLIQLSNNALIKKAIHNKKLNNWELDNEYVDVLFKELLKSDIYDGYMKTSDQNFHTDKEFIVDFYKMIIAPNDKLYDYLEDKNITWIDDLPVINTTLLKTIRKAKYNSTEVHFLPNLFRDEDDRKFGFDLLRTTISNLEVIDKEIANKTQNWDKDRITNIDLVLLQMAICEIREFSSIPVKVTINEYLEIAKEYSTPKSSVFINGILDKLVKEYTDKGTLNKSGRGLL